MKSLEAFLFILVIGCWMACNGCNHNSKPANQKSQSTSLSQKENKELSPSNKKLVNSTTESKNNTSTSSTEKPKPAATNNKKVIEKKPAPLKSNKKKSSLISIVNNTGLPQQDRLKALQTINKNNLKKSDYTTLKNLVQSEKEALKIKQEALKKIYKPIGEDEDMLDFLFGVLKRKNDPLKKDVLYALQTIKYSSTLLQQKQRDFLDALKTGLYNTNDKKTYYTLLKALTDANDPAGHEIVIDLLKREDFSKVSSKQLLLLLNKNVRPQHYATLHRIMQQTKNTTIKKQLISILVNHPGSKAQLIQYLGNKNQDKQTRIACAEAFMKHDETSFYSHTKNIIWDKEDDIDLRRKCLSLIEKMDRQTLKKYVSLHDDMLNMGISDNVLNQIREALLKKLDKNQY